MRVAVVGAGITGLSAALELRSRGVEVTVYETAARAGGVITSIRRDGYLVEAGPSSLSATRALETVVDQLGLGDQRIGTSPMAQRRYIVRDGKPVSLPSGPASLLTTDAMSAGAKLRLAREPFVTARRDAEDESVAELVRRRLGDEILTYLVDPMIGGIYAGDSARLSARHAMPVLYQAERRHGSLLRGAPREFKARRGVVRQLGITSFRDGLQTLPTAMAASLGGAMIYEAAVSGVEQEADQWRVHARRGGDNASALFDAVIYAGPAHGIGALGLPRALHDELAPITALYHPPLSTLALGFRRADITHPLDGFGMLCPTVERRNILGVLFSSSIFAGRAPADRVLLTCFIGGARRPELASVPDDELLALAMRDLEDLLGVSGTPVFVHRQDWPRSIPQYELGHERVLDGALSVESTLPGLYLAGQWRGGVALGDCLAHGQATAVRVVSERAP